MTFKNRIKDLRLEKELTQQALADALGISKQAISAYEQGNRKPGFEIADALAEFFGVSIGYLSGSSDERGEYPAARPDGADGTRQHRGNHAVLRARHG